jgi:signal transduction histidine kinase
LIKLNTLKIKVILPILFILILVFVSSSLVIINREYHAAKDTMIENSESYSSLSINSYIEYYQNYKSGIGFFNFGRLIGNLMNLNNDLIKIQIVDVNGKILFNSDEIEQGEYNEQILGERYLEENSTINRAGAFHSTTIVNEYDNYVDIMQPYFDEWDRHDYSVRYIFSLTSLEQSKSEMYSTLLIYAVFFILISFLLIYFLFNRFITSPITNLMKGVKTMTKGDLGRKIDVFSDDELGQLANAFNKMSMDLKKSQDSLKDYSENLEKLVTKRTEQLEDKTVNLEKFNKDLKKARKELNILNKNLEKRIKERTKEIELLLDQKDGFINQLSHDLKSPLTPLTILIPILEKQETNNKKKEILKVLNRNVEYMRNVAVKTLALAKLNSPKTKFTLEKLNLGEEISRIIKNKITMFKDKNLQIENNVSKKILVNADKLRLEELFINLLENSVKYSNEKGKIRIDAVKEKDTVKVSIKDTGIGMSKDQMKHVFEEFYKADESRHDFDSSGLGLSICKRIVERHNGNIWIESSGLNKGSTVFFTLPVYDEKSKKN